MISDHESGQLEHEDDAKLMVLIATIMVSHVSIHGTGVSDTKLY